MNDDVSITITNAPNVQAGVNQTICADSAYVQLAGVSNVAGFVWSTMGTGTFDNSSSLTAQYNPSDADTTSGTVNLILTAAGGAGCTTARDTMVVTITDSPTVEAGPDKTVCATNANVVLNGLINAAAGTAIWTTDGTGSFNPSATTLGATYVPSDADTAAPGIVILTLTTTGAGPCKEVDDFFTLNITSGITANAGNDQTVCANAPNVSLIGSVPTTGIWSTNGSGSFNPNNTDMNATYITHENDTTAGTIKIFLETTIMEVVPRLMTP